MLGKFVPLKLINPSFIIIMKNKKLILRKSTVTKIIFNSPTYGKYVLRPFFYINLMSDTPKAISDALGLIHKISPTKSAWNITVIGDYGTPGQYYPTEFIYYLIEHA